MTKFRISLNMLGLVFFDLTFLLFAFMGLDSDSFSSKLKVFYIPGNKNLYHFIFCIICVVILLWLRRGRIRIDAVIICLFVKMVFDYVNTFYVNQISYDNWTRWFQTNIGFLSYLIVINTKVNPKDVFRRFQIFAIIISLQVYHVFVLNRDLSLFVFKNAMRIPFALSNVIAGVLVAVIVGTLLQNDVKGSHKMILCSIYGGGVLLTYSRGAIFLLDLLLLWRIYKTEKLTKKLKWYLLWGITNIIALLIITRSEEMQLFFVGVKGIGTLNDFSTNRIDLLKYGLDEFFKLPVLGRGVYYDKTIFVGSTGIHNILLELLAESGIIGASLYIIALLTSIKKSQVIKTSSIDRYQLVVFGVLVSFFVNSLTEVVYFNYIYDVLFWSFAGVIKSYASRLLALQSSKKIPKRNMTENMSRYI